MQPTQQKVGSTQEYSEKPSAKYEMPSSSADSALRAPISEIHERTRYPWLLVVVVAETPLVVIFQVIKASGGASQPLNGQIVVVQHRCPLDPLFRRMQEDLSCGRLFCGVGAGRVLEVSWCSARVVVRIGSRVIRRRRRERILGHDGVETGHARALLGGRDRGSDDLEDTLAVYERDLWAVPVQCSRVEQWVSAPAVFRDPVVDRQKRREAGSARSRGEQHAKADGTQPRDTVALQRTQAPPSG